MHTRTLACTHTYTHTHTHTHTNTHTHTHTHTHPHTCGADCGGDTGNWPGLFYERVLQNWGPFPSMSQNRYGDVAEYLTLLTVMGWLRLVGSLK